MIIAIDFDGTLVDHAFPEIGNEIPHAFESLKKMKRKGHKLILWTCREDCEKGDFLTQAIEYCRKRGIEFDAVNDNIAKHLYTNTRKIYADYYIDDKALRCNYGFWNKEGSII